jgi:alpha 1,3-glucosidase
MVVIVDPHLKADDSYHVFSQANAADLLVRSPDGTQPYIDKCWPGESSWLDYLNPSASEFWSSQFLFENFNGSTESLWIWNDMNEPSVFGGPEITMDKSATHWPEGYGADKPIFEHREVHNMYGFLMTQATFQGQLAARPGKRPFILSRAFFAGSQRHVAVWTGDSMASWDHLKLVTPMLLALSLSGMSFVGSDIGGFFGNPDPELLIRWYETAVYTPFCRAHAHSDTARREPWLLEPEHTELVRRALKRRYALLPYLYTLFEHAHRSAAPIMRPIWYEFPSDTLGYTEQEGFMLGKALLAWPVLEPGLTGVSVRLPEGLWFDVSELFWAAPGTPMLSDGKTTIYVPAPLGYSPLLLRAGCIVPLRERPRRATAAMVGDPVSLLLGVGSGSKWGATGELYSDDGETFRHRDQTESLRTRYQLRHILGQADASASDLESPVGQWELSASTLSFAMMTGREASAATYRLQAAAAVSSNKGNQTQWSGAALRKVTVLGMRGCPTKAEVLSVTDDSTKPEDVKLEVLCDAAEVVASHAATVQVELRLQGLLAHGDWKVRLT